MGLQLPKRARRTSTRIGSLAVLSASMLLLGACAQEDRDQVARLAMPEPVTDRAPYIDDLWRGSWLTALIIGVLVWFLILYAAFKYRRRSDDEVPVQTRYNLPIEILYTIAPIIVVIVLFFFTVQTQNAVLAATEDAERDGQSQHQIEVIGQQWSWTFIYKGEDAVGGDDVYTVGTTAETPTLVLPVDESVDIELMSPDVIHSFWVPSFLMKMDVIPGKTNSFSFTPTAEGTYAGKCAELCGVYHSRMLFNVDIVSPDEFEQHLQDLQGQGNVGRPQAAQDADKLKGLEDEVQDDDPTGQGESQ